MSAAGGKRDGTRQVGQPRLGPVGLLPLLESLPGAAIPPVTALLGTCSDGRPVAVRLGTRAGGRLFVLGDDGAGKTALLRTAVMSVALLSPQRHVQFALLDPNGSLAPLAELPHLLTPRVRDPLVALDLLRFLINGRAAGATRPDVIVVADDLDRWWRVLAEEWLELAHSGPELGVHLIGAFAPPLDSDALALEWGAALWIIGRLADEQDREAAGLGDLPLGGLSTGSFYALTARDETRFRSAFVSARRATMLAEQLWDRPGRDLLQRPTLERAIYEG